ncbi:tetratricopeptide repeat protein [Pelagicoccus mobilis]|uniref:Tetratricopeptide repeat protein n=1 Tax=Pelagicoccus mobilis TaxID=415221 RepID=A0A934RZI8_9BACT|nr:tetratricopeptide repeat protein [Pelagicoccus mobilis]MBK1879178.1 hypothetical protein [Pelagicoccus mobilis]
MRALILVGLLWIQSAAATEVVEKNASLGNVQIEELHSVHDREEMSKYERLCRSAEKAVESGDHAKAFRILNEARQLEPRSVDAYLIYTRLHLAREEYSSAEKAAKFAIEVAPMSAIAWYQHSRVQYLKGEFGIAQEAAQNATKYMTKPSWEFYHWLGAILQDGGKLAAAELRYSQAQEMLESDLKNLGTGIRIEESKQIVTGMDRDTELVTLSGGEVVEREVIRLEKEYKEAPEQWHQMESRLSERLSDVSFDRYRVLVEMGQMETAQKLVPMIFGGGERNTSAMLKYFEGEFSGALKSFNATKGFFDEAEDSTLAAYLVCLAMVGESKSIERVQKKLSREVSKRESPMLQELLFHLKKAVPNLKSIKASRGRGDETGAASVHLALFHIGQGYPELAQPLLEAALSGDALSGFELKVATVLATGT